MNVTATDDGEVEADELFDIVITGTNQSTVVSVGTNNATTVTIPASDGMLEDILLCLVKIVYTKMTAVYLL